MPAVTVLNIMTQNTSSFESTMTQEIIITSPTLTEELHVPNYDTWSLILRYGDLNNVTSIVFMFPYYQGLNVELRQFPMLERVEFQFSTTYEQQIPACYAPSIYPRIEVMRTKMRDEVMLIIIKECTDVEMAVRLKMLEIKEKYQRYYNRKLASEERQNCKVNPLLQILIV